jgi:hypothetical protein
MRGHSPVLAPGASVRRHCVLVAAQVSNPLFFGRVLRNRRMARIDIDVYTTAP